MLSGNSFHNAVAATLAPRRLIHTLASNKTPPAASVAFHAQTPCGASP